MFTGYDTGCKLWVQSLKISLTLNRCQEIGQEKMPKAGGGGGGGGGEGGGGGGADIACDNNVTLALLVTSLTS